VLDNKIDFYDKSLFYCLKIEHRYRAFSHLTHRDMGNVSVMSWTSLAMWSRHSVHPEHPCGRQL